MGGWWVVTRLLDIKRLAYLLDVRCFQVVVLNLLEDLVRILGFGIFLMNLVTDVSGTTPC